MSRAALEHHRTSDFSWCHSGIWSNKCRLFLSVQFPAIADLVPTVQQQTVAQAFKHSVCLFVSWIYSDESQDWPGSRIVLILSVWGWQKIAAFYLLNITERKTRCATTKRGCKMPQKPGLCGETCKGVAADLRSCRHALLTPPLWTCQRFTGQ